MMKHEFEFIAKVEVSNEEYAVIERMYMDSPLDKVAFIKKLKPQQYLLEVRTAKMQELQSKLDQIEELSKRFYRLGTGTDYDCELNNRVRTAVGDNDFYAYNRQGMNLQQRIDMSRVLEVIIGNDNVNEFVLGLKR